jgi:hypothetical protein
MAAVMKGRLMIVVVGRGVTLLHHFSAQSEPFFYTETTKNIPQKRLRCELRQRHYRVYGKAPGFRPVPRADVEVRRGGVYAPGGGAVGPRGAAVALGARGTAGGRGAAHSPTRSSTHHLTLWDIFVGGFIEENGLVQVRSGGVEDPTWRRAAASRRRAAASPSPWYGGGAPDMAREYST